MMPLSSNQIQLKLPLTLKKLVTGILNLHFNTLTKQSMYTIFSSFLAHEVAAWSNRF